MIWLGALNRHHDSWEPAANAYLQSTSEKLEPLLNLLYENGMTMALPPDLLTLQTTTGNWTRPDNVWRTDHSGDLITSCNVHPELRPPGADHMPICELDLTISRSVASPLETSE